MKLYLIKERNELLEIFDKYDRVIIQFTEDWCIYCKKILPLSLKYFENLELENCVYVLIKREKFKDIYNELKIKTIPSFTIYDKINNKFIKPIETSNIKILKKYIFYKLYL